MRCREGRGGRGLGPHSGLLWLQRGPRGSRTQGCEQHGPPQDEVPLRREGAQVRASGSCGVLQPSGRAELGAGELSASLSLSFPAAWLVSYPDVRSYQHTD